MLFLPYVPADQVHFAELAPWIEKPRVNYAHAAALLDYNNGVLLYGQKHQKLIPPASLTKLVTLFVAMEAMHQGDFDLHTPMPVHPDAYATNMPSGSSLMFLGKNQRVTGEELLRGLLIASGNDAAFEIALRISHSIPAFAGRMNQVMWQAGYSTFFFTEPSGIDAANRITAVEFAKFCRLLLSSYDTITRDYTTLRSVTYPRAHNYVEAGHARHNRPVTQYNRNTLLHSYEGVDGLKTGYIDESGYNIAVSAIRDNWRLIAVVLGVYARSGAQGMKRRNADIETLLNWGYDTYESIPLETPLLKHVYVWGGDKRYAGLYAAPPAVTVPKGKNNILIRKVDMIQETWAPLQVGQSVGSITYTLDDQVIAEVSIRVAYSVAKGNVVKRVWDISRWQTINIAKGLLNFLRSSMLW